MIERFVRIAHAAVAGAGWVGSNDIVKEDGEVKTILDIELSENGAQVCLDRSFGYIERSCDGLVVAPLVYHARNFKLPWRKAFNRRSG